MLSLRGTYSSEDCDLLNDFYIPALTHAVQYDRAVGYFSAEMLSFAAQGLSGFVGRHGKMRLVIGEPLDQDEYEAIKRGVDLHTVHERLSIKLRLILDNVDHPLFKHRLELLSWLVGAGHLEVRIALTARGLYHEKIGILQDEQGDQVVFQGSANETVAALAPDFNFESVAVYPSWNPEVYATYGQPYAERFERLWSGNVRGVTTVTLPSEAYEALRTFYRRDTPPPANRERELALITKGDDDPFPSLPTFIGNTPYAPMGHQRAALEEWKARDFQGILALATGAGKTITALHGAVKLANFHRATGTDFVLVVAVPYQVLADQWCEVMELFNIQAIRCYRSRGSWYLQLNEAISDLQLSQKPVFLAAVVVNATLARDEFRSLLTRINNNSLMFIGDECHHHASASLSDKLPEARYRLGLSATPWSSTEHERKALLKGYYGGVVATYSLGRALHDGVLTPYDYHIHLVQLEDEEAETYERLSGDIAKLIAIKEQGGRVNEDELMHLFLARARILGSANEKFSCLEKLVRKFGVNTHTLFYCGDGSAEEDGETVATRDVERVARVLGENGWKTSRFTAAESHGERKRVMRNFQFGHIDAVVAIRVLDEGFDMPACKQAFLLASSRNDRQFIQRRGRILRRTEGKESATIQDFVVLPGAKHRAPAFRGLVEQELARVVEFTRFAANQGELWSDVQRLADDYDVDLANLLEEVQAKEVVVE